MIHKNAKTEETGPKDTVSVWCEGAYHSLLTFDGMICLRP